MNANSNHTNRPPRRARGGLILAAAVAGVAMVATTAPVVAGNLVTSKDLAKGAVTAPKIAKKAVKANKLANGAVKTKKIKDGAVTSPKLASGAVTRSHLAADLQPLWAVVWGGPSITRGNGAVAVAFEGVNSQYRVTFDRGHLRVRLHRHAQPARLGRPGADRHRQRVVDDRRPQVRPGADPRPRRRRRVPGLHGPRLVLTRP
jgi:hypothetical protein